MLWDTVWVRITGQGWERRLGCPCVLFFMVGKRRGGSPQGVRSWFGAHSSGPACSPSCRTVCPASGLERRGTRLPPKSRQGRFVGRAASSLGRGRPFTVCQPKLAQDDGVSHARGVRLRERGGFRGKSGVSGFGRLPNATAFGGDMGLHSKGCRPQGRGEVSSPVPSATAKPRRMRANSFVFTCFCLARLYLFHRPLPRAIDQVEILPVRNWNIVCPG